MKHVILATALAIGTVAPVMSQSVVATPGFRDNWSMGIDAGVTTPIKGHPFFGSLRPVVGLHVDKRLSPVFKLGVEGLFDINTSTVRHPVSKTAFDGSYVGAYGAVDLFNLFGGYPCQVRPFDMEVVAGLGWGHRYETAIPDQNYFASKIGVNFNFNVSDYVTINLTPSLYWDMTGGHYKQTSVAYDSNYSNFSLMAGVTYHFGGNGFECVRPYNQGEIDELNGKINGLRALAQAEADKNAELAAANVALAAELEKCINQPAKVVKEVQVNNQLSSVRYVFFKIGSYVIGPDQQPNVEMIAAYLNNHPKSKVVIKGYASKDGPEEVNIRLANQRAQAVKDALMKRYKIPSKRIVAEGEGIGNMFEEESWNRVAICILETGK